MNVPTREEAELIENFRASLESGVLEEPVKPANFSLEDLREPVNTQVPEGYYLACSVCDNCGSIVPLFVALGIPHPSESPEIVCGHCRVRGSVWRPPSEKEYVDDLKRLRKRFREGGDELGPRA